ncbi:hypothetical protein TNCT_214021 [Trichonephila clavata]|uniref:Uncharacterized protein n=1 Tax=Trichonephila clavata TaxID=2740835 RepID=A0A8X6L8Y2_TRICU|nr:hypothetical protein TNCT_214021 [Trichonephila clavata]
MTKKDKETFAIFERRVLRSLFGGFKYGAIWRRNNSEICKICKGEDIVKRGRMLYEIRRQSSHKKDLFGQSIRYSNKRKIKTQVDQLPWKKSENYQYQKMEKSGQE